MTKIISKPNTSSSGGLVLIAKQLGITVSNAAPSFDLAFEHGIYNATHIPTIIVFKCVDIGSGTFAGLKAKLRNTPTNYISDYVFLDNLNNGIGEELTGMCSGYMPINHLMLSVDASGTGVKGVKMDVFVYGIPRP